MFRYSVKRRFAVAIGDGTHGAGGSSGSGGSGSTADYEALTQRMQAHAYQTAVRTAEQGMIHNENTLYGKVITAVLEEPGNIRLPS